MPDVSQFMPNSRTCPKCGKTSFNPNDIKYQYCANCRESRLPTTGPAWETKPIITPDGEERISYEQYRRERDLEDATRLAFNTLAGPPKPLPQPPSMPPVPPFLLMETRAGNTPPPICTDCGDIGAYKAADESIWCLDCHDAMVEAGHMEPGTPVDLTPWVQYADSVDDKVLATHRGRKNFIKMTLREANYEAIQQLFGVPPHIFNPKDAGKITGI